LRWNFHLAMPLLKYYLLSARCEAEYSRRFLKIRRVKEYFPVYVDVQMKEKLSSLIASLQHLVPDITPTMLSLAYP